MKNRLAFIFLVLRIHEERAADWTAKGSRRFPARGSFREPFGVCSEEMRKEAIGGVQVIGRSKEDWEQLEEADWLFRKMVRRFVKERDKVEIEGVSLPGMLVLQKMCREGQQRLGDLAEDLDFTSGAVTGLCDRLEKKGLARRIRHESDRRSVWLDITPKGRELVVRNRNIGTRGITLLFADLTQEDLALVRRLFKELISRIDQYSETLNTLVSDNARQTGEEDIHRQGKYLSY